MDKSEKIIDRKSIRRLLEFCIPYKREFYGLILLVIALSIFAPIRPLLTKIAIDDYIVKGDVEGLLWILGFMIVAISLQVVAQFFHTYLSGWLGQYIIKDIRLKLYKHLMKFKMSFYDKTPIGRLVTRAISDVETLAEVFSNGLAAIISDLLQLVVIIGVMIYIDWKLTLYTLSILPLMIICTYYFKEGIKVTYKNVRNAVSKLNTFVQEHIVGMSIIQIFNSEEKEYKKFKTINKEHLKANIRTILYYSIYFPVAELMIAASTGLLIWYGSQQIFDHQMQLGLLISFIMFISLFFRPMRMLADRFNILQLGIVSINRITKLLDTTDTIQSNGKNSINKSNDLDIEFRNVSFAYSDNNLVLEDISFKVMKGQKIAIVGATGSGKSTIASLLVRFYDVEKGSILLGKKNINSYDIESLRKTIGIIPQDIFLFSDSIKNNILLGEPISDYEVEKAVELIGAKEFIESLPEKYNYQVMERGATLSIGQRQLIAFIRALVYNYPIIILDEATSSVDSDTESMIQKSIDTIMKDRTTIIIAHRMATIQKVDTIIVMDKGRIQEQGTHEELIQKDSFYAHLYNIQFANTIL